DLFVVRGLPGDYQFPHVLGSDGAGVVETAGPDVTTVKPGDAVMINPGIWDGTCDFCRAGDHSLCVNYQVMGEHVPGTLAESVADEVRALTARRGVDVVVENVGEATWEDSLRCLTKGGRLVTCGATSGPRVVTDARRLFWNQYTILGSTLGNATEYAAVVRVLSSGALRPLVDRVYPLAEARTAFERLARGEQLGKVLVEVRGSAADPVVP